MSIIKKLTVPSTLALLSLSACVSFSRPEAASPEPSSSTTPVDSTAAATTARAAAPGTSGRATINGIDYYYELHGAGEPLLVLHGGLGSIDMFGPGTLMPSFTKGRQVIAVDLQGHGRTTLGTRPIRCEAIADDLNQLLERLGRKQVDVLGYSFGGGVALRLAIQHPERVRRLALVSTTYADDGWYADMRTQQKQVSAAMAPMMAETPMAKRYKAVAPKDEFPKLLDAMGDFMRQQYDWSAEVAKLPMPVMLVFGDADMIRPEHEIKFYQLLGGGLRDAGWMREHMPKNRLAVIPDMTHYEAFANTRMAETVMPFLNGATNAKPR
jgi:pimeloyl-ACP methyl ester carboxylesterase